MHLHFVTRIAVYLKFIRILKYAIFEIKILRKSDFASCVKLCFENNPLYGIKASGWIFPLNEQHDQSWPLFSNCVSVASF